LRAIVFAALTIAAVLAIVLLALRRRAQPADTSLSPFPPVPAALADSIKFDDFVGSERCASCHSVQLANWSSSTHGRAGEAPPHAIAAYQRVVELDLSLAPAHFNMARALLLLDRKREALAALRIGLAFDAEQPEARDAAAQLEAELSGARR
jgi:hypothetical protein